MMSWASSRVMVPGWPPSVGSAILVISLRQQYCQADRLAGWAGWE
jgi:hypothetical protein